jgi:tetratricopeptide (TPR) repeat protein/transglutaminase-like putative cysteine protease
MRTIRTCLVVTMLAAPAVAKDWPVGRGPSREPEPHAFDPAELKQVPAELLRDYPACYLQVATWHLIEADGTVETVTHEVIRLNNRRGIDQLGEHRNITFRPGDESLTLNTARVVKAAGGEVAVGPDHVQLRDAATDYSVYDTSKELVISLPALEEGDVVEVKWTTRGRHPEYAGHFFGRYQFGDERYPVWRETFGVRVPKRKALKYAATNPHKVPGGKLEPEVSEKDGQKLVVWRAVDRRPVPKEELAPSKEELRPGVAFSTFASWEEVADWERKVRTDCWECTPEVKQIVEDVKRRHKEPEAVARALTDWVRKNVRYVSSGEKHDFTPHSPADVLRNRFGDCKDGAQLLGVLLKEAGIPSAFISLNARGDGQVLEAVPSPQTTHAILLATINGKDHWIDTTASRAAWDFLPRSDCGRVAYAVDDKSLRMLRTPEFTAADNRTEVVTRMRLDPDGTSHNARALTYSGEAALEKREEWLDVNPADRLRLVRSDLLESHGKAKLTALAIDPAALRDLHGPVKARIEFDVPQHFHGSDAEGSVSDGALWSRLLGATVDPERTLPVELKEQFESVHTFIIEAPPGYRLGKPPADKDQDSPWGRFTRTIESDAAGRKWTVAFRTRIDKTRVEKKDFDSFLAFQDKVTNDYRASLSLNPVEDAAELAGDIAELEERLAKDPKDRASATDLAKLLLRANRKEAATAVVVRALKAHPGDRKLLELAAQAAEGPGVAAAYRALVKQFPDDSKYALELGRRLAEAGEVKKAAEVLQPWTKKGTPTARADALVLLARARLTAQDAKAALRFLDEAEDADPDGATVEALCLRGGACQALGQLKEAREAYTEALEGDEKDAEALEGMIRLSAKANETESALKYLRRYAATLDAGGSPSTAAEWSYKLGRIDDAADLLKRYPPTDPADPGVRVQGLIDFRRGRWAEAVKNLAQSQPFEPEALYALIESSMALGDLEGALNWAGKIEKVKEPTPALTKTAAAVEKLRARQKALNERAPAAVAALLCAEYLHDAGKPASQVEPLLAKALADAPDLGAARALRAELNVERGRLLRALPDAEAAMKASPNDPRGLAVRGRIRLERGDFDGALTDLKRATQLGAGGRASAWYATALLQTGRLAEAEARATQAATLLPDDPEVKELLREVRKQIGKK